MQTIICVQLLIPYYSVHTIVMKLSGTKPFQKCKHVAGFCNPSNINGHFLNFMTGFNLVC